MTLFTKFDFKKHGFKSSGSITSGERKKYFYKLRKPGKNDNIILDLYIPKTRALFKDVHLGVLGGDGAFVTVGIDAKVMKERDLEIPVLTDGAAFLEAELLSQPCTVKDGNLVLFKDDLANLCNLTNQPFLNDSWKATGTLVHCPYCYGDYYLDPKKPHAVICPYCYMDKAEAQAEANKEKPNCCF